MPKRIVICCDGTWDTADLADGEVAAPSNVTRLALSVAPAGEDGVLQRVYYQSGIGTVRWKLLGGAFGLGLSNDVCEAYRFLVRTYEEGDEIFFVGFSRGAYTVRSVAGLIRNSGLLRPEHADLVPRAYALYRDRRNESHPRETEATLFRRTYSREPRIRFIGVWDTVGSLGIPLSGVWPVDLFNRRFEFHDTALSSQVDAAFQALSIDEHRKPFVPAIWLPPAAGSGQRVEQVWFAGCHSDVGGGGRTAHGLSDVPMSWMTGRARECGLALTTDPEVKPDPLGAMYQSRKGFYRLMPTAARSIGVTDPARESVASSVVERRSVLGYDPLNLREYLGRDGRVSPVG
ncbi:DUF2235 domain-containing protein [Amycolatopsis sp. PS_44_ISF1]|uniref:DUF2235 domain-containing protein n=1 Tax=Amycolatopsis sp. PS_44_ISF1 TaxID=2974917 RepID=UPI0028DF105E|nr:DUF2235 domain-containing protein [Amycolatopsis sp. PS_44_ISF1]MDT8915564.1 DUF2235 domain-containing protein [Amycolatopsis sp. PS_44_ISF1]